MGIRGGIGEFIKGFVNRAKAMDGKTIGEDGDFIKSKMANTDKQAWVNHLAEQYLKHEILDEPPPEFEINRKDIIKELTMREITKIFGK